MAIQHGRNQAYRGFMQFKFQGCLPNNTTWKKYGTYCTTTSSKEESKRAHRTRLTLSMSTTVWTLADGLRTFRPKNLRDSHLNARIAKAINTIINTQVSINKTCQ